MKNITFKEIKNKIEEKQVIITFSALLIVCLMILAFKTCNYPEDGKITKYTLDGAKLALTTMKDSAIWMATVQLAMFTAVTGLVFFKDIQPSWSVITAIQSLAMSIISAAAVLTSITSISLRLCAPNTSEALAKYNIYKTKIYTHFEGENWHEGWDLALTLEYVFSLQHILWFISIVAIAWMAFVSPNQSTQSK